MKTIKHIINLTVLSVLLSATTGQAQMSEYKFNQKFQQAFAHVLEGEYSQAQVVLETLYANDKTHGQVAFLLGMCEVKTGSVSIQTREILETACKYYDFYHQRGLAQERTAPARAWYYLAKVNAQLGRNEQAVNAYRNYMSCIPMASIDHKREIVFSIKRLKQQQSEGKESSILASRK